MGKAKEVTKVFMLTLTALIALSGAALLGLCVWLYLDSDSMIRYVARVVDHWVFTAAFFTVLGAGALTIVFAVIGFCGTGFEQRCCIAMYMVFVSVSLLAMLTGGAFAFIYRNEISSGVVDRMRVGLISHYGVFVEEEEKNRELTLGWDRIQEAFECCGVFGDVNAQDSWYIWQARSQWFQNTALPSEMVPLSCCVKGADPQGKKDSGLCQGKQAHNGPPTLAPPGITPDKYNTALHQNGCYDNFQNFLYDNALLLGALGFAIAALTVLGLVAAGCMFRQISKQHSADRRMYASRELVDEYGMSEPYLEPSAPDEFVTRDQYYNQYADMSMKRFDL